MEYTPLGGICVSLGLLKQEELHQILSKMANGDYARFGEVALEMGLLDDAALALALAEQYHLNLIPEHRLDVLEVEPWLLDLLPRSLMRQNLVVPLYAHEEQRTVSVIVSDPTDVPAIRGLYARLQGTRLRFFVGSRRAVQALVERLLGPADAETLPDDAIEDLTQEESLPSDRTLFLETDPERLELLHRLDVLEGHHSEFVQDPEQVVSLLQTGTVSRLLCRPELEPLVSPYQRAWRRIRPDFQVQTWRVFGLQTPGGVDPALSTRFFLDMATFLLLGGEPTNVDLRVRVKRTVNLARCTARQLGLSPHQVEQVALAALLVDMDNFPLARELVRDLADHPGLEPRFHLARLALAAWASPFDLDELLDALERRVGGGGPIGAHIGAEVVYTVRAVARRFRPGEHDPALILGEDVFHHFPRVLTAVADVLKLEALRLEMMTTSQPCPPEVLVALRDPPLLNALELELVAAGYSVVQAVDGASVPGMAARRNPCCMVLDFNLPRLRGKPLLEAIQSEPATRGIPVIFITESRPGMEAAEALENGAEDVLARPVNLRLLLAKIRRFANRAHNEKDGLRGRLQDLPLADLIQTLTLGGRTAAIRIRDGLESGTLHVVRGQLTHALYMDLEGEAALRRMVSLPSGDFQVDFNVSGPEPNLRGASEWLLLEALRITDEDTSEAVPGDGAPQSEE